MNKTRLSRIYDRKLVESMNEGAFEAPEGLLATKIFDATKLSRAIQIEATEAIDLCFDADFGTQFRERCPIAGTESADYQNRAYADDHGRLWVAGIRFRNLDARKAFIEVSLPVFASLPEPEDLVLFRELMDDFISFDVQRVQTRILSSSPQEPAEQNQLQWAVDKWIVAGRIEDIAQNEVAGEIELRRPTNQSFLEKYNEAYDALERDRAAIATLMAREDLESFAESLKANLLFEAYRNDEWIGLIAAEPGTLFGTEGALIREEILITKARGQGLGVTMQETLAARIAESGGPLSKGVLYGTIHGANTPSLKTALRAGRRLAGCYMYWFNPRCF